MTTAIIFDMDGVIFDSEPLYTRAEIKLFEEYGVNIPKQDWHLFRGCSEKKFFELSMKRYNITENKTVFINKGRQYVRNEFINNLTFMPGFKNLLSRIKSQHKTGVVTASPRHNLDFVCSLTSLDKMFEHIISGSECVNNKPHPAPYLDMMKRLAVRPENTIIIEDSITGLKAALSSNANVIAKTGSVPLKKLKDAHRIVSHLDEITNNFIDDLLQK